MKGLAHIPTWQLREAARVWRAADRGIWPFGSRNESLHDRIDQLVEEVARLRADGEKETRA